MNPRLFKRALRKEAIADRATLVARLDADAAARAIRDRFLETFHPAPGTVVSAFWPMGGELDVKPLLEALHALGCVCALPVVTVKHMPLTFRVWRSGLVFTRSYFGVDEPGPEQPAALPDISIVPLLAFDDAGFRLGYGGGYYDRTIEQLRSLRRETPYIAVGVAFEGQRRAALPHEPFDQPLDWIVTEERLRRFDRARAMA